MWGNNKVQIVRMVPGITGIIILFLATVWVEAEHGHPVLLWGGVLALAVVLGAVSWFCVQLLAKSLNNATIHSSCLSSLGNTNVMIADITDKITYMNESSLKTLTELAPEIRKAFSHFDINKTIGFSIHQFHKNPDRIRNVLANLREGQMHRGEINIGEIIFTLNVGPIFVNGKKVGHYAEWGDVTQVRASEKRRGEIETAVREIAQRVNLASNEIASGNANLSERTEAQAANVEQTTATVEQISERVRTNAENAQQALNLARQTRVAADKGGNVVSGANQAMQGITESAEKISNIIGVIDEIAFQTNLLALNAAVEAARAGEQGRGFAVVAGEVRTLAGRSAVAAKEIKELINESVVKVRTGSDQVAETQQCLLGIVKDVQELSGMVEQISGASQEQAESISEISRAVTQIDSFTQQNSALVEQATAAARSLQDETENLVSTVSH
jgi:DNA-binding ferritin-like protein